MHNSAPRPRAAHVFEEHTADVRVRITADSLPLLFDQAARALAEIMLDPDSPPTGSAPEQSVTVQAADREALLVEWLNELVYQSETHGAVYHDFTIESLTATELRATIRGVCVEQIRTAVKAATWHALSIHQEDDGFSASVVFDV